MSNKIVNGLLCAVSVLALGACSTVKPPVVQEVSVKKTPPPVIVLDPRFVETKYRISGGEGWQPKIVFDDRTRVFIQYPETVPKNFRPSFFLIKKNGHFVTATYTREAKNMLVVPELFKHGAVVYGTGQNMRIVYLDREK